MANTLGKELDYKLGPVDVTWEDQGDGTWAKRILSRNMVWDPVGLVWVRAKQSVLSTDTLSVTIPTPTPVTDNGGSLTVDATTLPLPTGAATEATLGTRLAEATFTARVNTQGQKAMAASTPVVVASDQSNLPTNITQIAGAAPSQTNPLPVRITDGVLFSENQPTYYLYQSPRVTTAAATDFFDLFNASGSGWTVRILGIYAVMQVTAANAIIPSFQFSVIKTSAVGTGGTAHTFEGAAAPAAGALNIVRPDPADAVLPAQVTSRSLPTGGATAAKFLFDIWLLTEETNSAAYQLAEVNWIPVGVSRKEPILAQGEGLKIRQITATASTGMNFGWLIVFSKGN